MKKITEILKIHLKTPIKINCAPHVSRFLLKKDTVCYTQGKKKKLTGAFCFNMDINIRKCHKKRHFSYIYNFRC